ncbi:MAG: hydroxyphenylacetyl-CoA thioesterase PaaI [Betaproteobacteria bacterium]|nr:hydroxyphenylacetyl-CoA thioesterase PaaI [Betaproteobacteria bacterium]
MSDSGAAGAREAAEAVGRAMLEKDAAMQGLRITLGEMAPGYARLSMQVTPAMLNGVQICHGGLITTLADSAFALACNSHGDVVLAAGITVDFLAPARAGDVLTAEARELSRSRRTGLYDVQVRNGDGTLVAVLRGRSHRTGERHLPTG